MHILLGAFLGLALLAIPALARDATRDSNGCHQYQNGRGYHCHGGAFNGMHFDSKREFELLSSGKIGKVPIRPRGLSSAGRASTAGSSTGEVGLAGKERALSGDMIRVGRTRIRLFGMDASELNQNCRAQRENWKCGQKAKKALDEIIDDQNVTCERKTVNGRRGVGAVCKTGKFTLNAILAREGWVLADPNQSDEFRKHELVGRIA
jgi:endonuclease YncB( thermonuclease family)